MRCCLGRWSRTVVLEIGNTSSDFRVGDAPYYRLLHAPLSLTHTRTRLAARKFGERFYTKYKKMPSALQAADYSATLSYLKAVQAAGTDDSDRVMAKLKSMKIDDMYTKGGYVRADGMMIHDIYLFEVKKPSESTRPWDYYKLAQTIPGEQAFNTLAESACPLVKK